ncbi:MAG TPA: ankyrin repeat domain-containing protein [Chthonomonadaceae bacterium]|nr:ankyrin repeat domain-containing protein [Chthonomonadaceae bacterium]
MIRSSHYPISSTVLIPLAVLGILLAAGCSQTGPGSTAAPPQGATPAGTRPPDIAPHNTSSGSFSPLIQAVQKGDADATKQLLAGGTDVNAAAPDGTTPLMHAANEQVAKMLLEKGADVNVKDKLGRTALIHAAGDNDRVLGGQGGANDDALVKLLLSRHADPNVISQDGTTALIAAIMHHKTVSGPLDISGSENARLKKVRLLLEAGANVNTQTPSETEDHLKVAATPLMAAAINGDPHLLQLLIDKGADVNSKDKSGNTALLYAARNGSADAVQLLIAHHADVNVRNEQGKSALNEATRMNTHPLAKCADLLRGAGAKE